MLTLEVNNGYAYLTKWRCVRYIDKSIQISYNINLECLRSICRKDDMKIPVLPEEYRQRPIRPDEEVISLDEIAIGDVIVAEDYIRRGDPRSKTPKGEPRYTAYWGEVLEKSTVGVKDLVILKRVLASGHIHTMPVHSDYKMLVKKSSRTI